MAATLIESFAVYIRNPNTRTTDGRAARAFLQWCEDRGIAELGDVLPVHSAAYVEQLHQARRDDGEASRLHPATVLTSS